MQTPTHPTPSRRSRAAGFTLLELCVVLVIATIMAMVAVPSFKGALAKYRVDGEKRGLRDSLQQAQNDSVGDITLSVCISSNGTSCAAGKNWNVGHILFVDDGTVGTVDGTDVVLDRVLPGRAGNTIVSVADADGEEFTRGYIHFEGQKPNIDKALRFTACAKDTVAQKIFINLQGRIWAKKETTSCA